MARIGVPSFLKIALGRIGDPRSADSLLNALSDQSSEVRIAALGALSAIGDRRAADVLLEELHANSYKEQNETASTEEQTVDRYDDIFLEQRSKGVGKKRETAAYFLGQIGDPRAVDGLLSALRDEAYTVQSAAVVALGQIGDSRAVDGLLEMLESESENVAAAAAKSLGQIGNSHAVDGLLNALYHQSYRVADAAATALGQIDDHRIIPGLLTKLRTDGRFAPVNLVKVLEQHLSDPNVVDAFRDVLSDHEAYHLGTRFLVAKVLARIGDNHAVDEIRDALYDDTEDDYLVKKEAAEALAQIRDGRSVDTLLAAAISGVGGLHVEFAIEKVMDNRLVDPLLDALQHHRGHPTAIRLLGRLGAPQAVPTLRQLIVDPLPGNSGCQMEAAKALEMIDRVIRKNAEAERNTRRDSPKASRH